ncbi:hypothetical protein E2320_016568 [Naja naja]|nr:hypothetical protein E2320_016568 [Naja naja]
MRNDLLRQYLPSLGGSGTKGGRVLSELPISRCRREAGDRIPGEASSSRARVGKSALMNQYVNNRFSSRFRATIGADFLSKEIHIDGRTLIVQIWDTAGTERFHALGRPFIGLRLLPARLDVTSVYSFQALEKWHKQLLLQIEPEEEPTFPVAIIGNKTDLENREVSSEEAEMWSRLHDATYFETSAKTAANVQEVFEWAIRAVLKNRRVPEEPELNSVHLETKPSEGTHRERCGC